MIRNVKISDAKEITETYNYYVLNTIVTFEETEISSHEMEERINVNLDQNLPWLVYEDNNIVLGYAYSNKWKSRCAYKNSLETTIYLGNDSIS